MILHEPFKIGARLLPALHIGEGWLSWDGSTFILDLPDGEHVIDGYQPGPCHGTQMCFADILSFMGMAGEEMMWAEREGGDPTKSEDAIARHFSAPVLAWCRKHYDDLSAYSCEFEEGPELIEE